MSADVDFDLYTILSITHRLPVEGAPYQEILKHMTGLMLSPLQSGRAREVCTVWLLEQHPQLAKVPPKPAFTGGDHAAMDAWADAQKERLGVTSLPVSPLPPGRYEAKPIVEEVMAHDPADPKEDRMIPAGGADDVWVIKLGLPEDLPEAEHHQLTSRLMWLATKRRSLLYAIKPTGSTFRFWDRESAAAFHAAIAGVLPSGSTVTVEIEDPLPGYVLDGVLG